MVEWTMTMSPLLTPCTWVIRRGCRGRVVDSAPIGPTRSHYGGGFCRRRITIPCIRILTLAIVSSPSKFSHSSRPLSCCSLPRLINRGENLLRIRCAATETPGALRLSGQTHLARSTRTRTAEAGRHHTRPAAGRPTLDHAATRHCAHSARWRRWVHSSPAALTFQTASERARSLRRSSRSRLSRTWVCPDERVLTTRFSTSCQRSPFRQR